MTRTSHRSQGFTLIELLVVMTIIATLAGLAMVGLPYYQRRADKLVCATNLRSIYSHLLEYEQTKHQLPQADGAGFPFAIWGTVLDKLPKEAEIFYCPSTKRHPPADLTTFGPADIDYTGPDQSSQSVGRNRLSTSMAGASDIPIVCNKLPNPADVSTVDDRRKNLPHQGKGFTVLYAGGSIEFIESSLFPDDLPVIGPEAPENMAKFRILKPGFGEDK